VGHHELMIPLLAAASLCFALQGLFGAWLTSRWSPRVSVQVLGAALFVLMPTLLIRIGHPALCAHWLLLWALVVATRDADGRIPPGRMAGAWGRGRPAASLSRGDERWGC
jgi:hypothetical protein